MMLIDTHAHLDFPEFAEDLDHILLRAKQAGVERIITIGTTLQSSRKVIQLAERYPQIYASVGIHPNSASQERKDFLSELEEMVKHPKVVAIGETGLDYHRLPSKQADAEVSQATFGAASFGTMEVEIHDEAEKAAQSTVFEQHLELAAAAGKSVVIHHVIPGKIQSSFFASTQPVFEQCSLFRCGSGASTGSSGSRPFRFVHRNRYV
jgi:TatD DNase family protein